MTEIHAGTSYICNLYHCSFLGVAQDMSEVYALEPAVKGKVIVHTTLGPLEIELWSKECPKACRNFVQLGMEGYYNGTVFHRLMKGFLIQGGDPTGTGAGERSSSAS